MSVKNVWNKKNLCSSGNVNEEYIKGCAYFTKKSKNILEVLKTSRSVSEKAWNIFSKNWIEFLRNMIPWKLIEIRNLSEKQQSFLTNPGKNLKLKTPCTPSSFYSIINNIQTTINLESIKSQKMHFNITTGLWQPRFSYNTVCRNWYPQMAFEIGLILRKR